MRCSTPSSCSAWAIRGAASRALSSPSTAKPTARPPNGRRAGQPCGSILALKTSRTSRRTWSEGLQPLTPLRGSSHPLQRLQIFNQIFLLLVGQLAADNALLVGRRLRCLERVAENTIAVDRRSIGCRRWEQGFAGFAFCSLAG